MSVDDASAGSAFDAQLDRSVDLISSDHLDRQVSLEAVIAEALAAYTSAWSDHRDGSPLDLTDSSIRADVSAFVFRCVDSVGEPENPQFPVRR